GVRCSTLDYECYRLCTLVLADGRRRTDRARETARVREPQLSVPADADREIRTWSAWGQRTLASTLHRLSVYRVDAELNVWTYRRAIAGPVGKAPGIGTDSSLIVHYPTSDLSCRRRAITNVSQRVRPRTEASASLFPPARVFTVLSH